MSEADRRFVVLHHVWRQSTNVAAAPRGGRPRENTNAAPTQQAEHWDLMLESDGALATWQLSVHPQTLHEVGARIPARRISDHRLAYLDYEGPISGDRGHVTRVDAGTYVTDHRDEQQWRITCTGQLLAGRLMIEGLGFGSEGWLVRIGS